VSADNVITLSDLSPGQKLEGTVKKVTLSGAIVDVGAAVDGLLHISDLGARRVTRTSDVLSEGQEVTTWVKRVEPSRKRLSLTLAEPPEYSWTDLEPGMKVQGKVVRLMDFGAFVTILPGRDGLVHISELADFRVKQTEDICKVGDEMWVKCLSVEENGRIRLSRKAALAEKGEE